MTTPPSNPAPEPSEADRMAAQLCAIAVRHDFDRASGTTNYNVKVAEIIGRHVATQHAALLAERDELRREVERLKESANFHRRLGITLLDAKWLDPECHKGCQSLLFKNALTAERTLREANAKLVGKLREALTQNNNFLQDHVSMAQTDPESGPEPADDFSAQACSVIGGNVRDMLLTASDFLPAGTSKEDGK